MLRKGNRGPDAQEIEDILVCTGNRGHHRTNSSCTGNRGHPGKLSVRLNEDVLSHHRLIIEADCCPQKRSLNEMIFLEILLRTRT